MTREKAVEIKNLVESNGGKINQEGYIIGGDSIWTSLIEDIIEREGRIFYCRTEKKMRISDWPEYMNRREDRAVSFVGFNGGEMALKVINNDAGHDHLEVWRKGIYLGYMHIRVVSSGQAFVTDICK